MSETKTGKITLQELSQELIDFILDSEGAGRFVEDEHVAVAGQSVFLTSVPYIPNLFRMQAFVNGVPQALNAGFFEDSGNTVRLGEACAAGDVVRLRYLIGLPHVGTDILAENVAMPYTDGVLTSNSVAGGLVELMNKLEAQRVEMIALVNRGVNL